MKTDKSYTRIEKASYQKNNLNVTIENTGDRTFTLTITGKGDTLTITVTRWSYDFDYLVELFDGFAEALADEL